MRTSTLVDDLLDAVRRQPSAPAFLGRRPVSRGALADRSLAVAGGLHARGLEEGETIGLAVRPGPEALAVVLGALRLRLRVAVVDPHAGADLVSARLRVAEARLVVADSVARAAAGWASPLARRAGLDLPRLPRIAAVVTPRELTGGPSPDRRGSDAEALVIFTSGTTGTPRAVVHTVGSLSAGIGAVSGLVDVRPQVPVLGSTFFVMGPALLAGAPMRLPPRRPAAVARVIRTLQPQLTYLTPPAARDLLATGARLEGRVYSGSAPVSAGLLTRLREAGADQAWGIYALTEAFPVAAVEASNKTAYDGPGDLLGELVGEMSARTEGAGQLVVSGPATCAGYLGEEPLSEVATGDRGTVIDKRLVLHGRMKDMVLRSAENIYPGLHEPSLHVPGVALAVLVGVPADDLDERLVLLVETEPGADPDDVRRRLRGPLDRMGPARPDHVVWVEVPTSGRSRKPDRLAAAQLAAALVS